MRRFATILFSALLLHIVISLIFVFSPGFLKRTAISKVYKTYFLPGPFFTVDRIQNSYLLTLSWRIDEEWSTPINPAKQTFDKYLDTHNLKKLYKSRFERSLYQKILLPNLSDQELTERQEVKQLKEYLENNYIPTDAEEARIVVIQKTTADFKIMMDTVSVLTWN